MPFVFTVDSSESRAGGRAWRVETRCPADFAGPPERSVGDDDTDGSTPADEPIVGDAVAARGGAFLSRSRRSGAEAGAGLFRAFARISRRDGLPGPLLTGGGGRARGGGAAVSEAVAGVSSPAESVIDEVEAGLPSTTVKGASAGESRV